MTINIDTAMIRTNTETGLTTVTIYTTLNDNTDGLEGEGLSLFEALYDLADKINEATYDNYEGQVNNQTVGRRHA